MRENTTPTPAVNENVYIPGWTGPVPNSDSCAPSYFDMPDNCGAETLLACDICCDSQDDCIGFTFTASYECVLKSGVFNTADGATQTDGAWCMASGCISCVAEPLLSEWIEACDVFTAYHGDDSICKTANDGNFYLRDNTAASPSADAVL